MVTKVELTGERATLFGTLYGRALDAGSVQPILGDHWARDVVEQIEVDIKSTGLSSGDEQAVALRAKQLDDWAREFLNRHTGAVVLHLGCGLDTRYFRLAPAPDVLWYDVDYPEAVALRSQLLPAADNVHPIGSSVTDLVRLHRPQAAVSTYGQAHATYSADAKPRDLLQARVLGRRLTNGWQNRHAGRRGWKLILLPGSSCCHRALVSPLSPLQSYAAGGIHGRRAASRVRFRAM